MPMATDQAPRAAADLAVAGVPGRRLQLFARPRVRGRGGPGATMPTACAAGSTASCAHGAGRIDAILLERGLAGGTRRRRRPAGRGAGLGRGVPRHRRAGAGERRPGPRLPRARCAPPGRIPGWTALRGAGDGARSHAGLSGGGRRGAVRRRRRSGDRAVPRLPAGLRRQSGLGRRAADPARPERRPAGARRRWKTRVRAVGARRRRTSASPISARPPGWSTGRSAATKPSTRGCSAHEPTAACASASAGRSAPARPRWSMRCASGCASASASPPSPTTSTPRRTPQFLTRSGALPAERIIGRRDRRLPAHRDPRGRLDQPRRRRRR